MNRITIPLDHAAWQKIWDHLPPMDRSLVENSKANIMVLGKAVTTDTLICIGDIESGEVENQ